MVLIRGRRGGCWVWSTGEQRRRLESWEGSWWGLRGRETEIGDAIVNVCVSCGSAALSFLLSMEFAL